MDKLNLFKSTRNHFQVTLGWVQAQNLSYYRTETKSQVSKTVEKIQGILHTKEEKCLSYMYLANEHIN